MVEAVDDEDVAHGVHVEAAHGVHLAVLGAELAEGLDELTAGLEDLHAVVAGVGDEQLAVEGVERHVDGPHELAVLAALLADDELGARLGRVVHRRLGGRRELRRVQARRTQLRERVLVVQHDVERHRRLRSLLRGASRQAMQTETAGLMSA